MAGAWGSWLCGIGSQEAEMNCGIELASLHPPDPWDGSLETLSQVYPEGHRQASPRF